MLSFILFLLTKSTKTGKWAIAMQANGKREVVSLVISETVKRMSGDFGGGRGEGGHCRGGNGAGAGEGAGGALDVGFVPETGGDELVQERGTSLDEQRGDAVVGEQTMQLRCKRHGVSEMYGASGVAQQRAVIGIQQPVTVEDYGARRAAFEGAHVEAGRVGDYRSGADSDCIDAGTAPVDEGQGEGCGEACGTLAGLADVVHISVGALGPFQDYVWPTERLGRHKGFVQAYALVGENAFDNFDAGFAKHPHSAPGYEWVRIGRSDHNTAYTDVGQEFGARGRLAIVRARFEGDVDGGLRQQMAVSLADGSYGVDLGMGTAEATVIALADYAAACSDDSAYHRIGRNEAEPMGCKLKGAAHICLVDRLECHNCEYGISKVSPCSGSPVLRPFVSQRTRCSDRPWLNESGISRP